MITLTVLSFNGGPLAQPLSARFDELGGNIGRADGNQLVLPDPERTISRVHAQVVFRSGRYAIVDRGSNPITVNGRPLGNGVEAPLAPGDEVQIGGYVMRAEGPTQIGGQADPFADLAGFGAAAPPPAAARAPGHVGGSTAGGAPGHAPTAGAASLDPLAAFGFGAPVAAPAPASTSASSPFGGLGGFGAAPTPAPAPSAAAPGTIPDDWDPFAPDPVAAPGPADLSRSLGSPGGSFGLEIGGAAAGPLVPDLPGSGAGSDSLDNLFGLGPAQASSGLFDPLANSKLEAPMAQPNMAAHADPLKSLGSVTNASGQAAADTLSELNAPFIPPAAPRAAPAQPAAVPPPPPAVPPGAVPGAPVAGGNAVMSWDDGASEGRTVIRAKARPAAAPAPAAPGQTASVPGAPTQGAPTQAGAQPAAAAPVARPPVAPVAQPAPTPAPAAAAAPYTAGAGDDALLAALREGLGVPGLPIERLTPELMRLIGQLLHESTKGTVELLVARAALKREVRAEVTMIVARENNPLKFSPSVEVALGHLMGPPARGFMPANRAMQDAYDDLRAHQFGFLAGMRAALEGVLQRFDPAQLEGKLTQKSKLSALLPGARKAQLWEVFQQLYGQISSEAQDDFHTLFGKAFLQAYEAHIDQLHNERDGQA